MTLVLLMAARHQLSLHIVSVEPCGFWHHTMK